MKSSISLNLSGGIFSAHSPSSRAFRLYARPSYAPRRDDPGHRVQAPCRHAPDA